MPPYFASIPSVAFFIHLYFAVLLKIWDMAFSVAVVVKWVIFVIPPPILIHTCGVLNLNLFDIAAITITPFILKTHTLKV